MSASVDRIHLTRCLRIGDALRTGNEAFKQNLGVLIGGTAMFGLFTAVFYFVLGMVGQYEKIPLARSSLAPQGELVCALIENLILNPLAYFFFGAMLYRVTRGSLRSLDGFAPKFGEFNEPAGRIFRYGLACLVVTCLSGLPAAVVSLLQAGAAPPLTVKAAAAPATVASATNLAATFLVLGINLMLIPFFTLFDLFIVDDAGLGIFGALQKSLQAGLRNYWRLLGLSILCGLVILLGLVCCLVGVLVTYPWARCWWAAGYRQLVDPAAVGRNYRPPDRLEMSRRNHDEQAWQDEFEAGAYGSDGSWDDGKPPR
ncbi:MAG: hypothetical protein ACREJ2_04375 [Planctomycetota bacterium]